MSATSTNVETTSPSEGAPLDTVASFTAPDRRFVTNDDASCRMFKADWMEFFSHARPWVPHVIFIPLIVAALVAALRADTAGHTAVLVLVLGGLIFWSLTEYVIHRYVFHPPQWIEDDTRRIVALLGSGDAVITALPTLRHKFYFLVHGVHHDYPNDATRLVMPPSVSIPLAAVFFFLFRAVLGSDALAAFAGFAGGYLAYDTIHFATHHASARSAVARIWKRRHFRHHYADSSRDFGISSPLWDILLGTTGMGRTRIE